MSMSTSDPHARDQSLRPLTLFLFTYLVAVPMLVVSALAFCQFMLLLSANERLAWAATHAAREAALPDATRQLALATLERSLDSDRLSRSIQAVQLEHNGGPFVHTVGTSGSPSAWRRFQPGDEVAVTLLIDPNAAAPNLVGWTGLDFTRRSLVIRGVAQVR